VYKSSKVIQNWEELGDQFLLLYIYIYILTQHVVDKKTPSSTWHFNMHVM